MAKIIPFNSKTSKEFLEVQNSLDRIQNQVKLIDFEVLQLYKIMEDEAEVLGNTEIVILEDLLDGLGHFYKGMLRNPKDFDSYNVMRDWIDTIEAYEATTQIEIDLDLDDEDD